MKSDAHDKVSFRKRARSAIVRAARTPMVTPSRRDGWIS